MKEYQDILTLKKGYVAKLQELETETSKITGLTRDVAEKECLYRESKAKAYLRLLAADSKVTVIPALAAGETAKIRLSYKIADGILRSARENVNRIHSQIEGYRSLISIAKAEINIR